MLKEDDLSLREASHSVPRHFSEEIRKKTIKNRSCTVLAATINTIYSSKGNNGWLISRKIILKREATVGISSDAKSREDGSGNVNKYK